MNPNLKMMIKKLQLLVFSQMSNEQKVSWPKQWKKSPIFKETQKFLNDTLLGPEVNPLEGSPNVKLRKLGPKGMLPTSNFRKG